MFIEPYLGNVTIFAGNYAPRSWMFCQGQLLNIALYDALFALIGTTYGGDGQNTFGLPDFRGRVPVGAGQGPGLPNFSLGQMSGSSSITLISSQMPQHTHTMATFTANPPASTLAGDQDLPTGNVPAVTTNINQYNSAGSTRTKQVTNVTVSSATTGGNQPLNIEQPYLVLNYVIAIEGIFPSRN